MCLSVVCLSRQLEKAKHVRQQRQENLNFDEAERQIQRAFVLRARTFGLDHPSTRKAKENLLKCYFVLGKSEEVKLLRDMPQLHLNYLIQNLEQFDEEVCVVWFFLSNSVVDGLFCPSARSLVPVYLRDVLQERRSQLSRSLRYMTKAAAMISFIRKDADADRLALTTRPRSSAGHAGKAMVVPVAHPEGSGPRSEGDVDMPPSQDAAVWDMPPEAGESIRFQGVRGGEDRLVDVNLMKGVLDGRPVGTNTDPRAMPNIPTGSKDMVGRKSGKQALTEATLQEKRRFGAVTIGELKGRTKDAMEKTNFSLSASLSRLALAKGTDPALAYVSCCLWCPTCDV